MARSPFSRLSKSVTARWYCNTPRVNQYPEKYWISATPTAVTASLSMPASFRRNGHVVARRITAPLASDIREGLLRIWPGCLALRLVVSHNSSVFNRASERADFYAKYRQTVAGNHAERHRRRG